MTTQMEKLIPTHFSQQISIKMLFSTSFESSKKSNFSPLYSCIEKHIEMQRSVFYPLNQSDCWPHYHFSWQGHSISYRLLTTSCHADTTGVTPLFLCSFYSLLNINFFFHFRKLSMNLSSSWPKSFSNSADPLLSVLLKTSTAVTMVSCWHMSKLGGSNRLQGLLG